MMDGPSKGSAVSPAELEADSSPAKNRTLKGMKPGDVVNRGSAKPFRFAQRGNNFPHPLNSYQPSGARTDREHDSTTGNNALKSSEMADD
jgi:hypothetical protein